MTKFSLISNLYLVIIFLITILLISLVFAENDICTDSDNGQNFFEKGRMIDSERGFDYSDYCLGSDRLVEFYCDPGYTFVYEDCLNYNKICKDGACIEEEPLTKDSDKSKESDVSKEVSSSNDSIEVSGPEEVRCTDSDNGQNFFKKGRMIDSDRGFDYSDYCLGSDRLVEFYCDPGYTFACIVKMVPGGPTSGVILTSEIIGLFVSLNVAGQLSFGMSTQLPSSLTLPGQFSGVLHDSSGVYPSSSYLPKFILPAKTS